MERDVRMPALKTEEAALLPALDRQSMTGGSALKYALQKAKARRRQAARNPAAPPAQGSPPPVRHAAPRCATR